MRAYFLSALAASAVAFSFREDHRIFAASAPAAAPAAAPGTIPEGGDDTLLRAALVILQDISKFKTRQGGTEGLEAALRTAFVEVTKEKPARFNVLDVRGRFTRSDFEFLSLGERQAPNHGPGIAEPETIVDFEVEDGTVGEVPAAGVLTQLQAALTSGALAKAAKLDDLLKGATIAEAGAPSEEEVADHTSGFPALPAHMPTCAEFQASKPSCEADAKAAACVDSAFVQKIDKECHQHSSDHSSCMFGLEKSYAKCCDKAYYSKHDYQSAGECFDRVAVVAALPTCKEYTNRDKDAVFNKKVATGCEHYESESQTRCQSDVKDAYKFCNRRGGCRLSSTTHRDEKFTDCTVSQLSKRGPGGDEDDAWADQQQRALDSTQRLGDPNLGHAAWDGMKIPKGGRAPDASKPESWSPWDAKKQEVNWLAVIFYTILILIILGLCYACYAMQRQSPKAGTSPGPVTRPLTQPYVAEGAAPGPPRYASPYDPQ
mmetsp:Transcript_4568/g.10763  ORF Transcript_4568/g.10763 Transcript_4568/m.10763 type:complete len:488 (+) Transcript_4568:28-1491(+)